MSRYAYRLEVRLGNPKSCANGHDWKWRQMPALLEGYKHFFKVCKRCHRCGGTNAIFKRVSL